MTLTFVPVGPAEAGPADDVFDLRVLAHKTDVPQLPAPCRDDFDGSVRVPPPATVVEEWAGYDEEHRCVVTVRLEFPVEENLDTCLAPVLVVHPAHRRRGLGRRAVAFASERAAARDRSRVVVVADAGPEALEDPSGTEAPDGAVAPDGPVSSGSTPGTEAPIGAEPPGRTPGTDAPSGALPPGRTPGTDAPSGAVPPGRTTAGTAAVFPAALAAAALGARLLVRLVHLRLAVADAPAPEPVGEGLAVRHWGSTIPDDLVHEAARLEATLTRDAPTGDLGWEPQPARVGRIRDFERMRIARGRRAHQCGIVEEATGRMVAWTALSMTGSHPDNALQAVTVVDPGYRGRGLGRLVKTRNLARCRAAEPELAHVDTWNAEANTHMRRVNAAFGFRAAGVRVMWEISVP
ncbi:GNAT family N-acetyltransferase [Streptomyces sp. NPDC003327]